MNAGAPIPRQTEFYPERTKTNQGMAWAKDGADLLRQVNADKQSEDQRIPAMAFAAKFGQ